MEERLCRTLEVKITNQSINQPTKMTNERLNGPTLLRVYNGASHIPITAKLRVEFLKKIVDNGVSITLNSYYSPYNTT